jgi:hypothetical protein
VVDARDSVRLDQSEGKSDECVFWDGE